MREFKNIEEFSKAFVTEDFLLDLQVKVGDETFVMHSKSSTTITEMLMAHKRPILVYTNEQHDKELVCFWTDKGNTVVPTGVLLTDRKLPEPELVEIGRASC